MKPWSFLNKRAIGGLNLLLKRAHSHRQELVELALSELEAADLDHLVVTGDLSNLSLDPEFELARELLAPLGDHRRVSVIPGNHDCYTYRSGWTQAFENHFEALLTSDRPDLVADRCYPWVKQFDGVAMIGLSSAIATPPPLAVGKVSRAQLEGLRRALADPEIRGRFTVVVVHHHIFKPAHKRLNAMRKLLNSEALLEVLVDGRADLMIHGHNHRPAFHEVPHASGGGVLCICEAGSTSANHPEDSERAAKYNIYEIDAGRLQAVRAFSHEVADGHPEGRFREWKVIRPTQ